MILEEPTFPGCIITARPVGVFWMEDDAGPDAKIICVPFGDPRWDHIQDIAELPDYLTSGDRALLQHLQAARARQVHRTRAATRVSKPPGNEIRRSQQRGAATHST